MVRRHLSAEEARLINGLSCAFRPSDHLQSLESPRLNLDGIRSPYGVSFGAVTHFLGYVVAATEMGSVRFGTPFVSQTTFKSPIGPLQTPSFRFVQSELHLHVSNRIFATQQFSVIDTAPCFTTEILHRKHRALDTILRFDSAGIRFHDNYAESQLLSDDEHTSLEHLESLKILKNFRIMALLDVVGWFFADEYLDSDHVIVTKQLKTEHFPFDGEPEDVQILLDAARPLSIEGKGKQVELGLAVRSMEDSKILAKSTATYVRCNYLGQAY